MQSEENKAIGLLQDENGESVDSLMKSINLLDNDHFPDSKEVPPPLMYFGFMRDTKSWKILSQWEG